MTFRPITAANVTLASLFIVSLIACGGSANQPAAKTAADAKAKATTTAKTEVTKAVEAVTKKACGCGKATAGCAKVAFAFDAAPAVGTQATCPVSGDVFPVQANSTRSEQGGKHYAFCCKGCKAKFDADPAKFIAARSTCSEKAVASPEAGGEVAVSFDAQPAVGTQARCPLSKKVFTVSDKTTFASHNGKHVAFCCPGCKGKFEATPQAFIK